MTTSSATLPAPTLLRDGVSPWIATLVACICAFMVVMDGAIVNVALPAIHDDLELSPVQLQWVIDIYLLALGGFMLLAARASDVYGRRRMLLWGLTLFTGASLAGGFAMSGTLLLVARAVQGLGAAVLATSPLAIILAVHGKGRRQERAIGMWAACAALGSAFGVVVGGVLTSFLDWRWVMFVNVPIGIFLGSVVLTSLRVAEPATAKTKLDVFGATTITLALGAFFYAISQSIHIGWASKPVVTAFVFAIVMFIAFINAERRSADPLIRLEIFRMRNVAIGMCMVLGLGAVLTTSMFFLSQTLQRIDGRSPLDTGLALLPMALALAIAAISSRYLRDLGVTRLPFVGGMTSAAGLIWLHWIPEHPTLATELLIPTILVGAGCGLVMMSATHAVLAGIPRKDAGLAAGLQNAARHLGGALGIALLATVAHGIMEDHIAQGQAPLWAELQSFRMAFLAAGCVSIISALASLLLRPSVSNSSE